MLLVVRQAGTWDPLPQCLQLDKCLLQQQNTKKLYGTKNNCVHAQVGQIRNKIQKDQNPAQEVGDHLSQAPSWTLDPLPPPPDVGTSSPRTPGASKRTCFLYSLHSCCSRDPVEPCLNFLSGLWSVSTDEGGQELWLGIVGMQNGTATLENTLVVLKTLNTQLPYNLAVPLLSI